MLRGYRRHGQKSAGVAPQYSGTAGTIDHGQIVVFLGYASPNGRTWLDRELYLPQEWLADPERALAAGVPDTWVIGDAV
jgi:SRSO17 transposase